MRAIKIWLSPSDLGEVRLVFERSGFKSQFEPEPPPGGWWFTGPTGDSAYAQIFAARRSEGVYARYGFRPDVEASFRVRRNADPDDAEGQRMTEVMRQLLSRASRALVIDEDWILVHKDGEVVFRAQEPNEWARAFAGEAIEKDLGGF